MTDKPIYLDAAATTQVDSRVKEAMLPYFDEVFGNASSNHLYGKEAKQAIGAARDHVAKLINASSKEIFFTSGATEAINWALKGYFERNPDKGNHIITVKTEHKAVLSTCEYLENRGVEVTYLDVNQYGLISLDALSMAIKPETAMICVMYVNNEIGVIQDLDSIAKIAREKNICFFCDATQAVGNVIVDVDHLPVDMLCISAHKICGPKGVGALYKRSGIKLEPLIHGGGQEGDERAGTYNTPGIVGFGEACRIAYEGFNERVNLLGGKRKLWESYFLDNQIGTINFTTVNRAPHILSVTLSNLEADEFLMSKSKEFVASTGSACNASLIEESHVLNALNTGSSEMILRISF